MSSKPKLSAGTFHCRGCDRDAPLWARSGEDSQLCALCRFDREERKAVLVRSDWLYWLVERVRRQPVSWWVVFWLGYLVCAIALAYEVAGWVARLW
jgi:hypothetical protein